MNAFLGDSDLARVCVGMQRRLTLKAAGAEPPTGAKSYGWTQSDHVCHDSNTTFRSLSQLQAQECRSREVPTGCTKEAAEQKSL